MKNFKIAQRFELSRGDNWRHLAIYEDGPRMTSVKLQFSTVDEESWKMEIEKAVARC